MHHANHFYGHAHVLARYCRLGDRHPPRINGYVQHGWNIGDGLAPGHPYAERTPSLLWSEQTRRRAWAVGRRNVVVIGAPFSYLLALRPEDPPRPEEPEPVEREGTIWYPFHGWEGQHVRGDHRELIARIRDTEPGPVTVCLYWHEYGMRRVRRLYERAGFRVICHGYRGHWWRDTDPLFLDKQLTELRRHKRVASNRLTSAIFYGIAAGCEPAVYGDPMVLADEDPTFGGTARIRRQWPELHGESVDLPTAVEIARAELGADHRCAPAELRELLGWAHLQENDVDD